jgi:hypothetical protein
LVYVRYVDGDMIQFFNSHDLAVQPRRFRHRKVKLNTLPTPITVFGKSAVR